MFVYWCIAALVVACYSQSGEIEAMEDDRQLRCQLTEIFELCPATCERTCEVPYPMCPQASCGIPRCMCRPGLVRHGLVCITVSQCPQSGSGSGMGGLGGVSGLGGAGGIGGIPGTLGGFPGGYGSFPENGFGGFSGGSGFGGLGGYGRRRRRRR